MFFGEVANVCLSLHQRVSVSARMRGDTSPIASAQRCKSALCIFFFFFLQCADTLGKVKGEREVEEVVVRRGEGGLFVPKSMI